MRHLGIFLLAFAIVAWGLAFGTGVPLPLLFAAIAAAVITLGLALT